MAGLPPPLEILRDMQQILELPRIVEEEIDLHIAGVFQARIGLNDTSLTRALAKGDYATAEKIVEEVTDPEFLNDGAMSATPLNMVLTGRSSYFHQSRNLKMAQLLLQKGANPNLRIPNHDMESASESPLELLLEYYLKLTEVFGISGQGYFRTSFRPSNFEETELLDTIGLDGEPGGLGPREITTQTRQLLVLFIERGGDVNLPTTDAAKSIYHLAATSKNPDKDLLSKMLEMGANPNLADVHNTTPLMDIIELGDESRSCYELGLLSSVGTSLSLDIQNCSLQSALWRAVFQGHHRLTQALLQSGASENSSARVEPIIYRSCALAPKFSNIKCGVPALLSPFLSDSNCTASLNVQVPRKRPYNQVFSMSAALHVSRHSVAPLVDAGLLLSSKTLEGVSALVKLATDHKDVSGDEYRMEESAVIPTMFGDISAGLRQLAVRKILSQVLFSQSPETCLKHLEKIASTAKPGGYDPKQFPVPPSGTRLLERKPIENVYEYEVDNRTEVELSYPDNEVDLVVDDISISTDKPNDGQELNYSSEYSMDAQYESSTGDTSSDSLAATFLEHEEHMNSVLDAIDRELEEMKTDLALRRLDRDLNSWELELQGTLGRINNYQRELDGLLSSRRESTNSNNERLEETRSRFRELLSEDLSIDVVKRRSMELLEELKSQTEIIMGANRDIAEANAALRDPLGLDNISEESKIRVLDENWSLRANKDFKEDSFCGNFSSLLTSLPQPSDHTEQLVPSLDISVSLPDSPPQENSLEPIASPATMASNLATLNNRVFQFNQAPGLSGILSNPLRTFHTPSPNPPVDQITPASTESEDVPGLCESSPDEDSDTESEDSDTWGGTFSLSHTEQQEKKYAAQHNPYASDAQILSRLSNRTLTALLDQLGIPAGLRPCFAIEAARLQLMLSLFNHQSINCDRNCEGEDSDSDSEDGWSATSDEESEPEDPAQNMSAVVHLPNLTDSDSSSTDDSDDSSSLSNFSQRSWYGSQSEMREGRALSPLSNFSAPQDSSSRRVSDTWLEDREDLKRMRDFLESPGKDFHHSSESESD